MGAIRADNQRSDWLRLYMEDSSRDTESNRQAVMESIERTLREHNGSFPEEGDIFIEPQKRKPAFPEGETGPHM